MSRDHVKELKATLECLTKDHLGLTATEALGFQNYERAIDRLLAREAELIAELKRVRAYNKKLEFDLRIAERTYKRLKNTCHERDFGTPIHPINPTPPPCRLGRLIFPPRTMAR
jgi:hypothetical protein